MRNATALCGCLFGVTGIVGISDVCRELLESRSNPAFPARARPWAAARLVIRSAWAVEHPLPDELG